MILQPQQTPGRARPRSANREMALGLVLLALVLAFLVNYGLGFSCRTRTSWPCRPSDISRSAATLSVSPTLASVVVTMPPASFVSTATTAVPLGAIPTFGAQYPTAAATASIARPAVPTFGAPSLLPATPRLGPATAMPLATATEPGIPTEETLEAQPFPTPATTAAGAYP